MVPDRQMEFIQEFLQGAQAKNCYQGSGETGPGLEASGLRPVRITVTAWASSVVKKQWGQRLPPYTEPAPNSYGVSQHLLATTPGSVLTEALLG